MLANHLLPGSPDDSDPKNLRLTRVPYIEVSQEPEEQRPEGSLLDYWHIFLRRKRMVMALAFVGVATGVLYQLAQPPVYLARTSLEIQPLSDNFVNTREPNSSSDPSTLGTQVSILQSKSIRARVLEKMKSQKSSKVFSQPSPLGHWLASLGLPVAFEEPNYDEVLAGTTLKAQSTPQTRIVEVFVESRDASIAANFANTLTNEFIGQNLDARWQSTQRTSDYLADQLSDLKVKLQNSENQLQDYARSAGLIFTNDNGKDTLAGDKLRSLQNELARAQADRLNKELKHQATDAGNTTSLPDILVDPAINSYEALLTNLRRELADLSTVYTPAHYRVQRVQAQIAEIDMALLKQRQNVLLRIRNDYLESLRREKTLQSYYNIQAAVVATQSQKEIHYDVLKREVDADRHLYGAILQKVKELGVISAIQASNIRVVDPATKPLNPTSPSPFKVPMLGLATGLMLSIGLIVLQECADPSVKAPGDLPAYLKVPELGVIPSAEGALLLNGSGGVRKAYQRLFGGTITAEGPDRIELVTWRNGPTVIAESFRSTLVSLLYSAGSRAEVVVITSPGRSEGKSTCTSNLAISLAGTNRRVLVVDADMRKPRQHEIFNIANTWGLSNILQEDNAIETSPLEGLCRDTEVPNLSLLPSGPALASVSPLLFSRRLELLLKRLRTEFDAILVDTPPMLHVSDARILARHSDGVVLVLRARQSRRDEAFAAAQRLVAEGTPVIGTILNDWNPDEAGKGYYNSYYQYDSAPGEGA